MGVMVRWGIVLSLTAGLEISCASMDHSMNGVAFNTLNEATIVSTVGWLQLHKRYCRRLPHFSVWLHQLQLRLSLESSTHHNNLEPYCNYSSPHITLSTIITTRFDAMPQPKASSTSILEAVFHHVALPPRLPHEADLRLDMTQKDLAQLLLKASITLRDGSLAKFGKQWDAVRRAIQTCKTLNVDAKLTKESLLLALRELTGSDILILHIPEQNAALLIRLSKE